MDQKSVSQVSSIIFMTIGTALILFSFYLIADSWLQYKSTIRIEPDPKSGWTNYPPMAEIEKKAEIEDQGFAAYLPQIQVYKAILSFIVGIGFILFSRPLAEIITKSVRNK